eukprot:TRINITY_DN18344_c0_g1_i1.p1 TRINITY_DN18344_c0_g1~~TRINITY_DN18344_c0_g1_i1.p1  ORF type:complete len:266 (+),score=61.36 TRINITY_DN18344_c0_g1_i1:329-1126(+)
MEMTSVENSESSTFSSSDVDHHHENLVPHINHGASEQKLDITEEELIGMLEVIAATGKFWHDWDFLKSLLSFRLKEVLAEYPESQTVSNVGPQPSSFSGETYPELVKRLDEGLLSFIEGPPFTLQRLCEILLTPQSIYPNLSKLALALEKNLLVTSTLTICTDPYPSTAIQKAAESEPKPNKGSEQLQVHSSSPVQNGVETKVGDPDEEMAEAVVEEEPKNTDMDTTEVQISGASEMSSDPVTSSDPSGDPSPSPPIEQPDSTSS